MLSKHKRNRRSPMDETVEFTPSGNGEGQHDGWKKSNLPPGLEALVAQGIGDEGRGMQPNPGERYMRAYPKDLSRVIPWTIFNNERDLKRNMRMVLTSQLRDTMFMGFDHAQYFKLMGRPAIGGKARQQALQADIGAHRNPMEMIRDYTKTLGKNG